MIPISYPAPRVSQLDATILDGELVSLLSQQLSSVFQLQSSRWWSYNQHPELWDLLLDLLVFRLTVWKSGSSYGLSLQNLKLTDFKSGNKIGYSKRSLLLAFIIGKYLFKKVESYLYSLERPPRRDSKATIDSIKQFFFRNRLNILSKINNSIKLLNLVNFTLFLISGRFPSLLHRVLGISLTPVISDLLKFNGDNVNFEFQNRQLVWNVMTEFLVFILPLLRLRKLQRMTQKLLSPHKKGANSFDQSSGLTPVVTPFSHLPISQCAICHLNNQKSDRKSDSLCLVTNPYVTNCGHIFCYVCLATKFNAKDNGDENSERCLRCGIKLQWFEEYGTNENDIDNDAIIVDYEDVVEEEDDSDENDLNEKEGTSGDNEREDSDYSDGQEYDEDEDLEEEDEEDDMDEGLDM